MALFKEAKAFGKAQVSAFTGGVVDYLLMLVCVELLNTHYVTGIVIGGIVGAVINYSINRYWSFAGSTVSSKKENAQLQIGKFVFVVIGSILLKSGGTTLLTEVFQIDYKVSRLITDAIVSFGFNYVLQRYWVFQGQMG